MLIEIPGYRIEIEYTPGEPESGLREGFDIVSGVDLKTGKELPAPATLFLHFRDPSITFEIWAAIEKKKREAEDEHFQSLEG